MEENFLLIVAFLFLFWELYRFLHHRGLRKWLRIWRHSNRASKPSVIKPRSELDGPDCQDKKLYTDPKNSFHPPLPRDQRKGRGGRKKCIPTGGYFCPNPECEYYGISDERVHALIWDGFHGKHDPIQDLYGQACRHKFTARRHTVLYRLKTPSRVIERMLWLLALGVDISSLEEVFGITKSGRP